MGENRATLEIKKKKLKEELSKPNGIQNKQKIKRLRDSINRHKEIAIKILRIRQNNRRRKNERSRDRWRDNKYS